MSYAIQPLMLGKMLMNSSLMTYMMNFQNEIWAPIVCWYVKAEDSNVLIDSGASADMMKKYWYTDYEEIMTFENALASVDTTPEEIDVVIQTHLHFDHCGNTAKCRNAQVIVQAEELAFSRKPHPLFLGSYLRGGELEKVNFKTVVGDAEVLPGIKVLHAPGHSPGTQAVSIQTENGQVTLSGFCSIAANFSPPEKIRKLWPVLTPGVHVDALQAFASAKRIKEEGGLIIPTHDMESASKSRIP